MQHYIHKVCPVILRQREESWQILAFRHPQAGTQLIKGTPEAGEQPESAVLRELAEESGINRAIVVEKIGELAYLPMPADWHTAGGMVILYHGRRWSHFSILLA